MRIVVGRWFLSVAMLGVLALLPACNADKDKGAGSYTAAQTGRVSVLEAVRKTADDEGNPQYEMKLPETAVLPSWPQAGGNTQHSTGHLAMALAPKEIWSSSIGSGSKGNYKLLSSPVVGDSAIYAMDSRGTVSAYTLDKGNEIWTTETRPDNRDDDVMGGGIALEGRVVYATTGFGEVLALNSETGAILWRQMTGKPLRSAPTVSEGRVFVNNIENETHALDAKSGNLMWRYSGIAENAALMGASSPAVNGNIVIVAYSSGEVFGLRAQNGRVVWSHVLAVPTQIGALPAIADIRGLPVIDQGKSYFVSHSGRVASVQEKTGDRVWEREIGGVNTPVIAGDVIFLVSLDNRLIALERETGKTIWTAKLQSYEDPDDRDSKKVTWWGPVLANGRLWLTNSIGQVAAFTSEIGFPVYDEEVAKAFYLPPIIANKTMYLLDDSGTLHAYR